MTDATIIKIRSINQPSRQDETTLALRAVTEKRAATIGYMLDEATELGIDDTYARKAIAHYGADNGRVMAASMQNPDNLIEFAQVFTNGLEANVYEMETIVANADEFIVHFHYCPYVNKWLQQQRGAKALHHLCDVCLEGDNAITQGFKDLAFDPVKTIARGDDHCEMRYFRTLK